MTRAARDPKAAAWRAARKISEYHHRLIKPSSPPNGGRHSGETARSSLAPKAPSAPSEERYSRNMAACRHQSSPRCAAASNLKSPSAAAAVISSSIIVSDSNQRNQAAKQNKRGSGRGRGDAHRIKLIGSGARMASSENISETGEIAPP